MTWASNGSVVVAYLPLLVEECVDSPLESLLMMLPPSNPDDFYLVEWTLISMR